MWSVQNKTWPRESHEYLFTVCNVMARIRWTTGWEVLLLLCDIACMAIYKDKASFIFSLSLFLFHLIHIIACMCGCMYICVYVHICYKDNKVNANVSTPT